MGDQDATTEDLLVALRHPIRREVLRALLAAGRPVSPRGLSDGLKMPLSNVSYHVRVLADRGAVVLVDTAPVQGSMQHFYEGTRLLEHPLAKAALEISDEGDRRGED